MKSLLLALLGLSLLLGGCAQTRGTQKTPESTAAAIAKEARKHPQGGRVVSYESPSPHKRPIVVERLRTTAYIGKKNAIGSRLSHGPVISAASDWSKFPLGTRFRVRETGKVYVIDDYGSALIGTKTLDLAQRNQGEVNRWGSRWVHIEILSWGSSRKSLEVLTPRRKVRYVRPMVDRLRLQAEGLPAEYHRIEVPAEKKARSSQPIRAGRPAR